VQWRLDKSPQAMCVRRETVEHPFGTLKMRMGATHFLRKTLPRVATEMASMYCLQSHARYDHPRHSAAHGGDDGVVTASQLSLKDRTHRELALLQWQSVNASARTHNQDRCHRPG
jgi:hypothetical protein